MLFEFDGSQAPNKGLNSMIITINPADALRVLNIQFTPVKDSNPNPKGQFYLITVKIVILDS